MKTIFVLLRSVVRPIALSSSAMAIFNAIHSLKDELMTSLDNLQAQVAASNTVMASAVTLLTGLHAQLQNAIDAAKAGDNHAALDQLSADLGASTASLSQAMAANTGAPAPAATPAPTLEPGADAGAPALTPAVDPAGAPIQPDTPAVS